MALNKINTISFIKKWEGGFVNHPADPGGATMAGVTLATFQSWRKKKGLPIPTVTDLKNITEKEWVDIFTDGYWNPWQADFINSQAVANQLVCWGWGSGPVTAIRQLQKLSETLSVDGNCGVKTLQYINFQCPYELFDKIWIARANFFIDIKSSSGVFLKGWLNRLYDIINFSFVRQLENNNPLIPIVSKLDKTSLRDIQKTIGVTTDGLYGPQTQAALLRYPSDSALKIFDYAWLKLKDMYVQQYLDRTISSTELKSRIATIYKEVQKLKRTEIR
jgi:lysozyme family protein